MSKLSTVEVLRLEESNLFSTISVTDTELVVQSHLLVTAPARRSAITEHRTTMTLTCDLRPEVAGRRAHKVGVTVSESEPRKAWRGSAGEGMRSISALNRQCR